MFISSDYVLQYMFIMFSNILCVCVFPIQATLLVSGGGERNIMQSLRPAMSFSTLRIIRVYLSLQAALSIIQYQTIMSRSNKRRSRTKIGARCASNLTIMQNMQGLLSVINCMIWNWCCV